MQCQTDNLFWYYKVQYSVGCTQDNIKLGRSCKKCLNDVVFNFLLLLFLLQFTKYTQTSKNNIRNKGVHVCIYFILRFLIFVILKD